MPWPPAPPAPRRRDQSPPPHTLLGHPAAATTLPGTPIPTALGTPQPLPRAPPRTPHPGPVLQHVRPSSRAYSRPARGRELLWGQSRAPRVTCSAPPGPAATASRGLYSRAGCGTAGAGEERHRQHGGASAPGTSPLVPRAPLTALMLMSAPASTSIAAMSSLPCFAAQCNAVCGAGGRGVQGQGAAGRGAWDG